MAKIFKNLTVEIKSGRRVTVGVYAHSSSRTGKTPQISNVDIEIPDYGNDRRILSQIEKDEVEKLVGEQIDRESWKF